ncbi:hypothetical protein D3C81_1728190 [compost metagenome]
MAPKAAAYRSADPAHLKRASGYRKKQGRKMPPIYREVDIRQHAHKCFWPNCGNFQPDQTGDPLRLQRENALHGYRLNHPQPLVGHYVLDWQMPDGKPYLSAKTPKESLRIFA